MGDMAEAFRRDKPKLEYECPDCEGAGFNVAENGDFIHCKTCNGHGVTKMFDMNGKEMKL